MSAFWWFVAGGLAAFLPCLIVLGILIWRANEGANNHEH
jgi:hypothetical protein